MNLISMSKDKAFFVFATFWAAVAAIAAVVALVVGVVSLIISIKAYNDRYNTAFTDANSAIEVKYTFESNGKTIGSKSVQMTAGNIHYGYFQENGAKYTRYALSYKKSNEKNYKKIEEVVVYCNNTYYGGNELITTSDSAYKYDQLVEKITNVSVKSIFIFDWIVE